MINIIKVMDGGEQLKNKSPALGFSIWRFNSLTRVSTPSKHRHRSELLCGEMRDNSGWSVNYSHPCDLCLQAAAATAFYPPAWNRLGGNLFEIEFDGEGSIGMSWRYPTGYSWCCSRVSGILKISWRRQYLTRCGIFCQALKCHHSGLILSIESSVYLVIDLLKQHLHSLFMLHSREMVQVSFLLFDKPIQSEYCAIVCSHLRAFNIFPLKHVTPIWSHLWYEAFVTISSSYRCLTERDGPVRWWMGMLRESRDGGVI